MPALGTKLHLPTPRRQLVMRPRLIERLRGDASTMPRLILLAAPAGFGKTTVLTQWLGTTHSDGEGAPPRVAWLSLDKDDSDLGRFLAHVVAAFQTTNPEVGSDAVAQMDTDRGFGSEEVLVSLINDLDTLAEPTVLALDDYHLVESPEVHQAVSFLLDNLPGQVTLAMTTRADPPLPLGRLRARDEVVELRAADLRFTDEEAEHFFNDLMGLGLAPVHVAALETRTEGWAAGLQLAALSARGRSGHEDVERFVEAFTGSHRFVIDYLVEEVLRGQPDDMRAFLLDTSVLHELTGPLCDAVTGRIDGQQTLERLERLNLFLVPLDKQRLWFRYHHLFADALRAQLGSTDPQRPTSLHRAAAQWYTHQARLSDAITHALAAPDVDMAAELLELALGDLRRKRHNRALRDWLVALPTEVVRQRPLLSVGAAWTRLTVGDLEGVEAWLDAAEAGLDGEPVPTVDPVEALQHAVADRDSEVHSLPATIEVYRASLAQARHDIDGTAEHARRALSLSAPTDYLARSGAAGYLGLAAWARGDVDRALRTFTECVRNLHLAGATADELGATIPLASMWLAQGRPDEALRLLEGALRAAELAERSTLPVIGDLHVGLAEVLCERGDLEEAERHLQAAQELGDRASFIEHRHRWHAVAANLLRARGDIDGAVVAAKRAEDLYLPGFLPDTSPLSAAIARLLITQGRLADAWDWAHAHEIAVDDEPTYLAEYDLLTLARLGLAQARADDDPSSLGPTTGLLDRIVATASEADRRGSLIEALVVRALVRQACGDGSAALDDLGQALAAGAPAGYVRMFLDEGQPLEELLDALARSDQPEAEWAAALLRKARTNRTEDRSSSSGQGYESDRLSERELEVLRLLASDLTGPEIAGHLFVSVNTLRSHTKHIFTKLDVNTRRAAVTRARDLGLL